MLIKIKGRNEERFKDTLTRVIDLACVVFSRGRIPTDYDKEDPERTGRYWIQKDDTFDLLPLVNNYKAFIRERGDNYVILEFHSRYDKDRKEVNSLSNLIMTFFSEDEVEEVLQTN